jgi:hypothetical protein
MSTHVAQKDHHETLQESLHFISMMPHRVAGMDPDDILNMDQTPIPFSYPANHTLKKGTKTIHVRSSTMDTKQATLAAAVTGSGNLLIPMLIFKGKVMEGLQPRSSIATPLMESMLVSPKPGWMRMHILIDKVLIPWKHPGIPT